MPQPRVLILRAPGSNCDGELQFAFEKAGALPDRVHINQLRDKPDVMRRFQILAIPGGFSGGDDVTADNNLAMHLAHFLADSIREVRDRDKPILVAYNGFQILLKAGLLLQADEDHGPLATLTNTPHGFQDRWIRLSAM